MSLRLLRYGLFSLLGVLAAWVVLVVCSESLRLTQHLLHTTAWYATAACGMTLLLLAVATLTALQKYQFPYAAHRQAWLRAARFGLLVLLLTAVLGAGEGFFRSQGFVPGVYLSTTEISFPDSLVLQQTHAADERGINYLLPHAFAADTSRHINAQGFQATFHYDTATINTARRLGKKIILLIGDSFVEGYNDSAWSRTFPERLRQQMPGCLICNFGISGMDPVQYQLVAEKYVPLLQPDLVLVAFCGSNDVMETERYPQPHIPMYYQTNAAWLPSTAPFEVCGNLHTTFADAYTAYKYYRQFASLQYHTGLAPRLCRPLVVSTLLYYACIKHPVAPNPPVTNARLRQTAAACTKQPGTAFKIVLIPAQHQVNSLKTFAQQQQEYAPVFKGLEKHLVYYTKGDLTSENDYLDFSNGHFNDKGNRKFAAFLQAVIEDNTR